MAKPVKKKKEKEEITTTETFIEVDVDEKAIEEAEEVIVENVSIKEEKKEEKVAENLEIKSQEFIKQPNVRVKPNKEIKTFIGDRWYYLKPGKVEVVPQNVKDILLKAGVLDPM